MNNKKIGTQFEREFCDLLASRGYWVHFLSPAPSGAQPFDVIAVKDGRAWCYDCKTSTKRVFGFERLEQNQIMAFERWMKCGNTIPRIAVKYENKVYIVNYKVLKEVKRVNLLKEDAVCIADLTENQI